jgi:hypothetical protein
MSGNRANAAARNRRAGGGPEMQAPIPGRGGMVPGRGMPAPGRGFGPSAQQMQQIQQLQAQQMQQQQQMPAPAPGVPGPTQMTVQNAVTLMSIRLGRLETFMQKMEGEGENENARMVDDGVFNSIVSRLDALERGHKLLSGSKPLTTNNESNDQLLETINDLKSEVAELKDLLLGLQSFTMLTNQKLVDIVFSQEQEEQEEEDVGENLVILPSDEQDFAGQDLTGSLNVNLKELIQQELSNTDISEIVAEQ